MQGRKWPLGPSVGQVSTVLYWGLLDTPVRAALSQTLESNMQKNLAVSQRNRFPWETGLRRMTFFCFGGGTSF
jgi:hypothetical protein